MDINDRMFELLKSRGISQTEFAQKLDVRVATISDWKRHRSAPLISRLAEIADILGVSVDYLVTGKEYTPSPSQTVNQGIFGDSNKNNTVNIHGDSVSGEIELELLRICVGLDIRRKNALLSYAYNLEKETSTGN